MKPNKESHKTSADLQKSEPVNLTALSTDQVQEELRRVAGSGQVQLEDRKNLAYVKAVIHETQRLANILPLSLPHRTSQDVTFQGFFIQKGSTVFPLLTSVLYDETEWENPHSFHPAHFLDTEGRFVKRDAFMPFSAGRRSCLVEALARMELFMFFSTLLQNFRFTPEPGVSEEDLDLTAKFLWFWFWFWFSRDRIRSMFLLALMMTVVV
ncbi:cytochrome P450 2K1-like [Cynoglossus semilaevis]|uniref:cytochrome P450 2K1-like n=1 Tax=Cynoglossus semilaevis TaxID=244447 RepID=UPI000D624138|nr:cytochrome P450 2K1-like [Cynoglossus semilaevis]